MDVFVWDTNKYHLMACLEVSRGRRVEGRREVRRRVEENGYPPPYFGVFKIK